MSGCCQTTLPSMSRSIGVTIATCGRFWIPYGIHCKTESLIQPLSRKRSGMCISSIPDSSDFPRVSYWPRPRGNGGVLPFVREHARGGAIRHIAQVRVLALDSTGCLFADGRWLWDKSWSLARILRAEWKRIDLHPLMQAELRRQASETERISALREFDGEALLRFKLEAKGQSLFDLSALMAQG